MTSEQDYITRGIIKFEDSNIKRFAYGYYAKVEDKHYLILDEAHREIIVSVGEEAICGIIEITQAPDMWTSKYDKNKKKIWENDRIKVGEKYERIIKYCQCLSRFVSYYEETWEKKRGIFKDDFEVFLEYENVGFIYRNQLKASIEVISNTHGIKTNE